MSEPTKESGPDLETSNAVGEWHQEGVVFMCPGGPVESDECDCGYKAPWEYRSVLVWHVEPGYQRSAHSDHRDTAQGRPPLSRDGWWVIAGWDERCPNCGDIERFDHDGTLVRRFTSLTPVTEDPELVIGASDLRAILAMTDLLVDLTARESMAVQRARASLGSLTGAGHAV